MITHSQRPTDISTHQPELFLPEPQSNKGPAPKRLKGTTPDLTVSQYMKNLQPRDWGEITVRNTTLWAVPFCQGIDLERKVQPDKTMEAGHSQNQVS